MSGSDLAFEAQLTGHLHSGQMKLLTVARTAAAGGDGDAGAAGDGDRGGARWLGAGVGAVGEAGAATGKVLGMLA